MKQKRRIIAILMWQEKIKDWKMIKLKVCHSFLKYEFKQIGHTKKNLFFNFHFDKCFYMQSTACARVGKKEPNFGQS